MAIRFRVEGDLRFISHHDTMRLYERALSRAQLPVRFSEGFNPRAKMSLPLPRSVGVATSADMLVIELCDPVDPSEVLERLRQQMPAGLTLDDAFDLPPGRKLHPERVSYQVTLAEDRLDSVRGAIERLLAAESWPVERTDQRGRPLRSIDLRTMLIEAIVEPGLLRWICRVPDNGSARPSEWLAAFGLNPPDFVHLIHRTNVEWQTDALTGPTPEPVEPAVA